MKRFIIFTIVVFAFVTAYSQQIVAPAGGSFAGNGFTVCHTIGEPAIASFGAGSTKVFVGFQQPYEIESSAVPEISENEVFVFPNPSANSFNIKIGNATEVTKWEVMNIHGTIIAKCSNQTNDFSIDLSSYPKGIYYLKINRGEVQVVRKLALQ